MIPDTLTWIDTCYVQNILRKRENDESIKISKITVKPATEKGDNYSSDMYRVGAEFSQVLDGHEVQDKGSLIVKVVPMDEVREKMVLAAGVFEIEISMMSNTLPRMNLMLTELGMTSLSAQCLFIQQEKPVHLVFEDLRCRGFQMAVRQAGLDLDHCLLAMRNLGRFHASSAVLKEKDSKALANYTKGMFHKDRPPLMRILSKVSVEALAKEVRNWHELSPRIPEKLLKLSEVLYDKGCEVTKYREDEFNVLVHGDFWINNMLFRYDELRKPERKPIEHIFVDFQICHHGSPAIDILYFFASSLNDDVRMNHRDKILREYHNSLTSTMAKLKCNTEALSFADLQETLKRFALWEVIVSFLLLPMVLLDKGEAKDLNEVMLELEGKFDNPGFRGSTYKKVMTRLLPLYDGMGLLDV